MSLYSGVFFIVSSFWWDNVYKLTLSHSKTGHFFTVVIFPVR
eukprot:UN03983